MYNHHRKFNPTILIQNHQDYQQIYEQQDEYQIQNSQIQQSNQQDINTGQQNYQQHQHDQQAQQIPQNIFQYHQQQKNRLKKQHDILINNLFKTPQCAIHSKKTSLSSEPQLNIHESINYHNDNILKQLYQHNQQKNNNKSKINTLRKRIILQSNHVNNLNKNNRINSNNNNHHNNNNNNCNTIEIQKIKQNISKLTYSIKTIQSKNNNQDIGISTKRVIMGIKNPQIQKQKHKILSSSNSHNNKFLSSSSQVSQQNTKINHQYYRQQDNKLNHGKFFAKSLKAIKKKKEDKQNIFNQQKGPLILFDNTQTKINSEYKNPQTQILNNLKNKKLLYEQFLQSSKKRQKSLFKIKNNRQSQNVQSQRNIKQIQFLCNRQINTNKKISLSNLLGTINLEQFNETSKNKTLSLRKPLKYILENAIVENQAKKFIFNDKLNLLTTTNQSNKNFQSYQQNSIMSPQRSTHFKRYRELEKQNTIKKQNIL